MNVCLKCYVKATGLGNISAIFLKDEAEIVTSYVTHIINLSLVQGTFPNVMKAATVIPIFKK